MRDIERIDKFCSELAEQWKQKPDLRFGQFMWCVFTEIHKVGKDGFFVEEDEMMKFIKSVVEKSIDEK